MTYAKQTWTDFSTVIDKTHMDHIEDGLVAVDGRAPVAALAYGTSLPASPVDGQEAVLVDSVTNPSYSWRFRYNAGSTSPYKWEFVGGPPATAQISTQETTASTTAVDLATVGPQITVARAGDYVVRSGFNGFVGGTPNALMTVTVNFKQYWTNQPAANLAPSAFMEWFYGARTVGTVFKMQYQVSGGTGTFYDRFLAVTPARVS